MILYDDVQARKKALTFGVLDAPPATTKSDYVQLYSFLLLLELRLRQ